MRNRGFTLIELLLVLAIFAILGAMAAPMYARFLTQNALSNSVDQIVQDVRKAQFYAMTSRKSASSGWGVNIDDSTNTITLYQGSAFSGHTNTYDEVFTLNDNITITPSSVDLRFTRVTGIPSAGATITISGQGNSKTITVNSQGVVTR